MSFVEREARRNPRAALEAAADQLHEFTSLFCMGSPFVGVLYEGEQANDKLVTIAKDLQRADGSLFSFKREGRYPRQEGSPWTPETFPYCANAEAVGEAIQNALTYMQDDHSWDTETLGKFATSIQNAREAGLFNTAKIAQLSGSGRSAAA